MTQRLRRLIYSGAGAALVLGILAALDLLGTQIFARLDLSDGKIYSISPGTTSVLRQLKDTAVIKVYFTPGLPPPYGLHEQYLKDLLGEYTRAGRGKVRLELLNPEGDDRARKEALSAGVMPVRLSVMARDKFELKEAYMGVVILYGGKAEVMPVAQNPPDFEYELTRRLKRLAAPSVKTIGFVTGHGEKAPGDRLAGPIFEAVAEQLRVETVSLDKPVAAGIDALWILGPQSRFTPQELERLKAWVGSGRSLGVALDRRSVSLEAFRAVPLATGLEGLLEAWGALPREGFVADEQCEHIQLETRQGMFRMMQVVEYPLIPIATDINVAHPATRALGAVSLPFAHPIAVKPGPLAFTPLISSSKASWYQAEGGLSPLEGIRVPPGAERGSFPVAGVLEGDFYKVTPSTAVAVQASTAAAAGQTQGPGRVALIGTSRFLDAGLGLKPASVALLLNLLEWSLQDEALLSIRAKGTAYRPLKSLPPSARRAVKLAFIFLLPCALLAAGGVMVRAQSRRRQKLAELYG